MAGFQDRGKLRGFGGRHEEVSCKFSSPTVLVVGSGMVVEGGGDLR
ncbi:hypothetical protein COLO4_25461 [Corchorus olitorius]|uniref:Uncharacterized protein n=1 Tax=Corchorus olitorius TaxID=93759 RepID=A0A1R3I2G8_9ROSI|nr:hypothetical protein COLO4_25461 [Corchorus olitorius]